MNTIHGVGKTSEAAHPLDFKRDFTPKHEWKCRGYDYHRKFRLIEAVRYHKVTDTEIPNTEHGDRSIAWYFYCAYFIRDLLFHEPNRFKHHDDCIQ